MSPDEITSRAAFSNAQICQQAAENRQLTALRPSEPHIGDNSPDLSAARDDRIVDVVTEVEPETRAPAPPCDPGSNAPKAKSYNGFEKRANAALARLRASVERGFAVL